MHTVMNRSEWQAFGQDLSSFATCPNEVTSEWTEGNVHGCLLQSYWNNEQITNTLNVTFYSKKICLTLNKAIQLNDVLTYRKWSLLENIR